LESEFPENYARDSIPDLKKEINFFRNFDMDDIVEFIPFKNKKITINNVKIAIDKNDDFHIIDRGEKLGKVPGIIKFRIKYEIGQKLEKPFVPPDLGITCLGPSHGFDPNENTSGFIIWLNGIGIMIDPPVNSTEWLRRSNVNPKLINAIILTHCHADHDAGTFQKIIEEGKITDLYNRNYNGFIS